MEPVTKSSRKNKKLGKKGRNKLTLKKINFNSVGNVLIALAFIILMVTFWPVVREETKYNFNRIGNVNREILTPPNTDFAIVIPKIAAVAPVFADVNWQDSSKFLPVLRRGVAHAKGTAYPGEEGNTYIFAHSTDAFYNVGAYNAVFYLIGKLNPDDEINIYYQKVKYVYKVYDKKVVGAGDLKYLGRLKNSPTLTLQTCYPPGTTLRRLVVLANLAEINSNP